MTRSIPARIAAAVLATGAATAFALAGAGAANAGAPSAPGQGSCTASEYASYQVRADGWATAQGAKFTLLRNGVVITSTPNRANAWAAEFRSAYGTFPGPGYYSVCAQNTGTANTIATVQVRTDAGF